MKPRNFPARKLARQIAAGLRINGRASLSAQSIHREDVGMGGAMSAARAIRTKKRRASL